MSFSEVELAQCEADISAFMERRRPPVEIRNGVDFGARVSGSSVEIFEIRPHWKDKSQKTETPIAKATFVQAKNQWNLYWQWDDMKWHSYEPNPTAETLATALEVVGQDEHACFFG